jgi:hypothetical protein
MLLCAANHFFSSWLSDNAVETDLFWTEITSIMLSAQTAAFEKHTKRHISKKSLISVNVPKKSMINVNFRRHFVAEP